MGSELTQSSAHLAHAFSIFPIFSLPLLLAIGAIGAGSRDLGTNDDAPAKRSHEPS